jgi:hypothetical protein
MHDEKLLPDRSDPLRHIDVRFEPRDPVFDADEPVFGGGQRLPRPSRRKPRNADAELLDAMVIE